MSTPDITERLVALIAEKKLAPGSRIPSGRELAALWGVSRPAVSRVLHQMEGAGLLQRDGQNWRVGEGRLEEPFVVQALIRKPAEREVAREIVAARGGRLEILRHEARRKMLLQACEAPPDGLITTHRDHLDVLARLEAGGCSVILCHNEWKAHSFVTGDHGRHAVVGVEHLQALGHRQIAFLFSEDIANYRPIYEALITGYRTACLAVGLRSSARRILELDSESDRRELARVWQAMRQEREPVTAAIFTNNRTATLLGEIATKERVRVPEQFSILSTHEAPECAMSDPPLTAVGSDHLETIRVAATLVCADILERRQRSGPGQRHGIRCQPKLTLRVSTAPPPGAEAPRVAASSDAPERSRWADATAERLRQATDWNTRRYPEAISFSPERFRPLDVSRKVNRSFQPRSSWLGDLPLLHFEPGEHEIHGVPFRVCRGSRNANHCALVLRSARAHTRAGEPLPLSVSITVQRRVHAVYFLQAAGWAIHHKPIANYRFVFSSGREEILPVVAYGRKASEPSQQKQRSNDSLIQDWHSSMEPFVSDRAKPFLITADGDPLLYERYLYTCQWMNPDAGDTLQKILVESADPDSEATLALLAVTVVG